MDLWLREKSIIIFSFIYHNAMLWENTWKGRIKNLNQNDGDTLITMPNTIIIIIISGKQEKKKNILKKRNPSTFYEIYSRHNKIFDSYRVHISVWPFRALLIMVVMWTFLFFWFYFSRLLFSIDSYTRPLSVCDGILQMRLQCHLLSLSLSIIPYTNFFASIYLRECECLWFYLCIVR